MNTARFLRRIKLNKYNQLLGIFEKGKKKL